jgi:YtkA-like
VAAQKWDSIMRYHLHARALIGAAIFATSTLIAAYALAAPNDYRFELVQAQPAGPGKTTVTVRFVHVPDNKPVAGAVLFETKTDMGPSGMAEMTGKVSPLPADQPGIYRFQIETGMAGKWALNIGAKVQGEPGTVRGTVNFDAAK